MMNTLISREGFNHLDSFLNFWNFGDNALLTSEKLSFSKSVAIVLLVKKAENSLCAFTTSLLDIFLD